jgi:hypothetical protein
MPSAAPRLFISYSWSTPEHEQWVLDLATELMHSGVDVILDKWALREGHDSVEFMEKMVTDPSISKVILVCDRIYAAKADQRAGGVGTETQIISPEVYARTSQDKFVAIIAERDEEGKPFLPTYYKSRIYVDLSESDRYAENFEKLLRWIFNKPLHVKPELGKPPAFLTDVEAPLLGTSALAKRVIEGFKGDKGFARGALDEYLISFADGLERFRIANRDGDFDEHVIRSIEDFIPYRNELLNVVTVLLQYSDPVAHAARLHRFFEALIPYLSRPQHLNQWNEIYSDNFKFIVHELFLYTLAALLRAEQFEAAAYLLAEPYYISGNSDYGRDATVTYAVFREHMDSLKIRNQRLELRRLSLRADLLEQRARTSGMQFRHIMQADFVCYLRAELTHTDYHDNWWPETLLYVRRHHGAFEIFARSTSKTYLARTLRLLDVPDLASVKAKLEEFSADRRSLPRWDSETLNPAGLLGFDRLGTKA